MSFKSTVCDRVQNWSLSFFSTLRMNLRCLLELRMERTEFACNEISSDLPNNFGVRINVMLFFINSARYHHPLLLTTVSIKLSSSMLKRVYRKLLSLWTNPIRTYLSGAATFTGFSSFNLMRSLCVTVAGCAENKCICCYVMTGRNVFACPGFGQKMS